jgi:peptide/nickel transport system permease protein
MAGGGGGALAYAGSRLLTAGLIAVGAMALLFSLTLLVPGNPADVLLGPRATPEVAAEFTRRMGLDRPLPERLLRFFAQVLRGDLGLDVVSGRPVLTMVLEVLPHTLALALAAMGLAVAAGVPLGCLAAARPGSRADQLLAVASVSVIAVPSFVVAVFLLLVFSLHLAWLPVLGAGRPGDLADQAVHLVLPGVALALGWVGYLARLVRASLLEVLAQPYIRTARACGVGEARIILKYALRNACLPTLAIMGMGLGRMVGYAVFAEIIFARPGVGKLIYDAIGTRNYPVVQGGVLVVVLWVALVNLLVDLSYAWVDPRIRAGLGRPPAAA